MASFRHVLHDLHSAVPGTMAVILPPGWRDSVRRAPGRSTAHHALAERVLERALTMAEDGPLTARAEANGRRLAVAREFSSRVRHGLVALALTGDPRFARMIADDIGRVLDLPDWSDVSFLDTAEIGMALCLAMDCLGATLSAETTEGALSRLEHRLLRRGIESIAGGSRWARHEGNWAIVGGAAMIAAAAVMKDRVLAQQAARSALGPVEAAMAAIGPGGEWPEGVIYRDHAAGFAWLASRAAIAAPYLQMPTDLFQPLLQGANFRQMLTGPSGMIANFGDDLLHGDLPVIGPAETELPAEARDPLHLLWGWRMPGERPAPAGVFIGKYHAVLRDGADFLAVRIGNLPFNDHAHADLAAPIWDHGPLRILADPGRGDYAQSGYFDPALRFHQFPAREVDHNTMAFDAHPMAVGMSADAVAEGKGFLITLSTGGKPLWQRRLGFSSPGHLQLEDTVLGPLRGGATWSAYLCAMMNADGLRLRGGAALAIQTPHGLQPTFSSWTGGTCLRVFPSPSELAAGLRVGFQVVDTNRRS